VGSGLRPKTDFRKPVRSLVPKHISLISDNVQTFIPSKSVVITDSGRELSYDVLVVAAGLQINWNAIKGLREALADSASGVSSIYSYSTCDKVWNDIEGLRSGKAVFTQPAGVIKCAGGASIVHVGGFAQCFPQLLKRSCGWHGTDSDALAAVTRFPLSFSPGCPLCLP